MLESIIIWSLLAPTQVDSNSEIPVQAVVVSLIDDVELALGEAGIVHTVKFQPGERVKAGDLLAQLDKTDVQLDLQRVEAELAMTKLRASNDLSVQLSQKSLAVAKTELLRAIKANEKFAQTVSASEIDRLQLRLDEAELQVQQAQHDRQYQTLQVKLKEVERAIAQRNLARRELRSPIDGVIVKLHLQAGEWAHPDQPLCRIINMDRIRVEGFVNTSHGLVDVGDKVRVLWGTSKAESDNKTSGVITFVDPEIDTITGQYKIWAEVSNKELRLRPGFRPEMIVSKNEASTSNTNSSEPAVQ